MGVFSVLFCLSAGLSSPCGHRSGFPPDLVCFSVWVSPRSDGQRWWVNKDQGWALCLVFHVFVQPWGLKPAEMVLQLLVIVVAFDREPSPQRISFLVSAPGACRDSGGLPECHLHCFGRGPACLTRLRVSSAEVGRRAYWSSSRC